MHCYRMSTIMAFTVSNSISLFYLAIVILSFTTHYAHNPHLIDICNTIWLTLLAASTNDFVVLLVSYNTLSESSESISPSPSIRTPSPHTPNQPLPHADEQGLDSFLDLSSEESFQDSGLGVSISSREDVDSEEEETADAAELTSLSRVLVTAREGPASSLRKQSTPSLSSESSSVLTVLDTLGADYDEEEEEVTLEVMASQWGSARRRLEGMHKDIIMDLINRLAELSLGPTRSKSAGDKDLQTKPQRPVGNATEQSSCPVPIAKNAPKFAECCELADSTSVPDSWADHNFCHNCSTFRRFIRPMAEDSFFQSTRLAVDNLTHPRSSHYLLPNQPAHHHILSHVFEPFGSIAQRCFLSRIHDGVIIYKSAFGVVDFRSGEEAFGAFLALQGRRIQGEKAHWRLEFLDPEDETFGDRLPTIYSEQPLELIRQLDVVARELGRSEDASSPTAIVGPGRTFETVLEEPGRKVEASEPHQQPTKLNEKKGGAAAAPIFLRSYARVVRA